MNDVRERIEQVLAETVRPLLTSTGGDVHLLELDGDGVARIAFVGTCSACPSTVMTLLMGIEAELRQRVPEVAYLEVASGA
ncbi:MAG TPA: NifU family protein [Gemmatales bacterium]|nr:NifU family protein [Gemmatales bacterium]HMP60884.1 NifU family protein [Gemmatales bacterium]